MDAGKNPFVLVELSQMANSYCSHTLPCCEVHIVAFYPVTHKN